MAIRGPEPGVAIAAYRRQWSLVREWLDTLTDDEWQRPSAVLGWRISDLVAHFGLIADSISAAVERLSDEKPLRLGDYLAAYAEAAGDIDSATRAASRADRELALFTLDAAAAQAEQAFEDRTLQGNPVVAARRGPVVWSNFLRTRCIELVVHADDLARSLPERQGPASERACVQIATRALADVLAARAPGRSVELRVPPFAAIQCVSGPRHTRGTPAAVVETDPLTFCRLAAGRISWREALASGVVVASGLRTDLSPFLPLL